MGAMDTIHAWPKLQALCSIYVNFSYDNLWRVYLARRIAADAPHSRPHPLEKPIKPVARISLFVCVSLKLLLCICVCVCACFMQFLRFVLLCGWVNSFDPNNWGNTYASQMCHSPNALLSRRLHPTCGCNCCSSSSSRAPFERDFALWPFQNCCFERMSPKIN